MINAAILCLCLGQVPAITDDVAEIHLIRETKFDYTSAVFKNADGNIIASRRFSNENCTCGMDTDGTFWIVWREQTWQDRPITIDRCVRSRSMFCYSAPSVEFIYAKGPFWNQNRNMRGLKQP